MLETRHLVLACLLALAGGAAAAAERKVEATTLALAPLPGESTYRGQATSGSSAAPAAATAVAGESAEAWSEPYRLVIGITGMLIFLVHRRSRSE